MLWNFSNFVIDANTCLHYNLSENCKGVIIVDEILRMLDSLTEEQEKIFIDYLRSLIESGENSSSGYTDPVKVSPSVQ